MSDQPVDILRTSPTAELELINKKRAALQNLIKIAATLSKLHQGLQSVLLMGKSVKDIPGKIISKYSLLNKKLDNEPTDKLKKTLTSVELKIQSDVKSVLEISQKSDAELAMYLNAEANVVHDYLEGHFQDYVDAFKKKGQTCIALRIALGARNAIINAFKMPVPVSFIEQQINHLSKREAACRKQIISDIDEIRNEIELLMSQVSCPDGLKQTMSLISENLYSNRQHVAAGRPIDEMPNLYESIEVSSGNQYADYGQTNQGGDAIVVHDESSLIEEIIIDAPEEKRVKQGFFSRFWSWLNTPMNVKWKDIEKYK